MPIDNKPAVGRIVLRDSYVRDSFCTLGGVITKISGSRIYYKDERGRESFCSKFSAIVDTMEEQELLYLFNNACEKERRALRQTQRAKWEEFFNET